MRLKRTLLIFIIISNILMTGCWSSREINTLAISVCMGIDKTDDGYLVTQQIINPRALAAKKTVNEAPVIVYSETGKDIFETIRRLTTKCPRKIYFSHMKLVIFGEELAKNGIKEVIDFLARDHEFRTDFNFVVAKGTTAHEVMGMLTSLESIPAMEMYNSLNVSEKSWAPTKSLRMIELVNSIVAKGLDPVISGVELTGESQYTGSIDVLKQPSGYKRLKYTNIGVLKEDRLVGWLNENEGKGYNYIRGKVKNTVGYTYLPNDVKITFEINSTKTDIKVVVKKGKPVVNVNIHLIANISTVDGEFDVTKEENAHLVSKYISNKLTTNCQKAVSRVKEEFNSDIFGFGEAIHRQHPKLWHKLEKNWDKEFPKLQVNITGYVKIDKVGQISKPFFMKEKQ